MTEPSTTNQASTTVADDRPEEIRVALTVNGVEHAAATEARVSLADFLRDRLGLTGTHLGCEQGICGACTVLVDGEAVRACLLLAVQADGAQVSTVEGLAEDGQLDPLQQAFWENHSFQCGFCTPGFLMTVHAFLKENPEPTAGEVREALAGNLCRCTGYHSIVTGVMDAAERLRGDAAPGAAE